MDIEALIIAGSYGAIFLLMIANGIISLPSSQALYLIAGYFVFTGALAPIPTILLGALGNTVGNIILYEIIRAHGRSVLEKFRLFDPRLLAKVEIAVRKNGWWFLFFGKLLPAIKVFVPVPAALGKMHRGGYALVMFLSSTIWATAYIALGYYFGKSFKVWGWYGAGIMVLAFIIVMLFLKYIERIEGEVSEEENAANEAAFKQ